MAVVIDETVRAAVELAGDVKGSLVEFALSPPFQRHLRRIAREVAHAHPDSPDRGVMAVERLLFDFRYDDGTTIIDRFVRRPRIGEAERAMALGFLDGVDGFFEVLADAPAGATEIAVRCCLSDVEHVVVPTEPAGVPRLPKGSFLAGRMNPVAGTDVWTPSGSLETLPPSSRSVVAEAVEEMVMQAPWLTHRNPDHLRQATEQVADAHERFIAAHGSDLLLVAGKDLAGIYADAIVPAGADEQGAEVSRAVARRTIEESGLAEADDVLVCSHPVAGFGFYRDFSGVARALETGVDADPDDLDLLRGYLDDSGVPAWVLRRIITDRLPAAEEAIARATARSDFDWSRDGEQLLASTPGDQEPTVTMAILPSLCSA